MVFICFLFEVFQRVECFRAFLNLIEDNQRFLRQNLFSRNHRQKFNDPLGIFVCRKDGFQLIFLIKVEVNEIIIIITPKRFHQPCFSDLSGTFQHHWFPIFAVFPIDQCLCCITFQANHRLSYISLLA